MVTSIWATCAVSSARSASGPAIRATCGTSTTAATAGWTSEICSSCCAGSAGRLPGGAGTESCKLTVPRSLHRSALACGRGRWTARCNDLGGGGLPAHRVGWRRQRRLPYAVPRQFAKDAKSELLHGASGSVDAIHGFIVEVTSAAAAPPLGQPLSASMSKTAERSAPPASPVAGSRRARRTGHVDDEATACPQVVG